MGNSSVDEWRRKAGAKNSALLGSDPIPIFVVELSSNSGNNVNRTAADIIDRYNILQCKDD